MKSIILLSTTLFSSLGFSASLPNGRRATEDSSLQKQYITGIDIGESFDNSLWPGIVTDKYQFAMIESSKGESVSNVHFTLQNNAARAHGLLTGAVHVADPLVPGTTAENQATVFSQVGGMWQADGKTLPGALKLENPPNSPTCFGMTPDDLGYWIKKFAIKYRSLTTRSPTILSTTEWLETCLGTTGMNWIPASSRLWIIHYSSFPGPIPSHWSTWTFWRSDASKGVFNYNLFNGNALQLKSLATTSP